MGVKIGKDKLLAIYEKMVLIRKFEEKAITFYEDGSIMGSLHLYIGEEAVAATVCACLNDDDYITSTHRGHGHIIAKGADIKGAMAELLGKETGHCKGRGGSMHITDMSLGILGANGIVAGGIPIATGAALASKYKNSKQIAVAFFGDGASNEGAFHESANLAGIHKLPIIYLCENNGYGISTPLEVSTAVEDISVRGASYNMKGVTVDGNDVYAIYDAMTEAVDRARAGEGPTLLECKTYRFYGHWYGDPQPYRSKEEVMEWKTNNDPIERFKRALLEKEGISEEEIAAIEQGCADKVEEAAQFAKESPLPDASTVLDYVFYED